MNRPERRLVYLLRALSAVTLAALPFAFLPRAWLAELHAAMGLGAFSEGPVPEYLARSLSLFYALLGGLLGLLSTDVRRYAPVIAYLAWAGIGFAAVIAGIDWLVGLPLWWILGEGPAVALWCLGLLWCQRRIRPDGSVSLLG